MARILCESKAVPRKEFFESWEAALHIQQTFGEHLPHLYLVDLAAGHALICYLLLILEPACKGALAVDIARPEYYGQ